MEFTKIWNLQEIIEELTEHYPVIDQVYLFGSRAYQTNSLRSDIDLLALTDGKALNDADINSWLPHQYKAVDLFWSYDGVVARSSANGSIIQFRKDDPKDYQNLPDQLDAILLWDKAHGFYDGAPLQQESLADISFPMSIIPDKATADPKEAIAKALKQIAGRGVHTFFAGSTFREVSETIIDIIQTGMQKPGRFQTNSNSQFNFEKIQLCNETDFQTFIHLLLRPLFKDIEPEPVTVIIDGNKKSADFGLNRNKIIIEAKWINTNGKKCDILKTLDGLQDFYSENPQVRSLIFLILYSKNVDLDEVVLTERFSKKYADPPIFICFLKNSFE